MISKEELEKADKQYFPQPGDKPSVIERKAINRQIALNAMIRSAGPGYKPPEAAAGGESDVSGLGGTGGPKGPSDTSRATSQASPLDQAREAIARGAPRDAVIERLRRNGIDPGDL